ncbi:hypothetical protein PTKU64_75930 [Paraburkholderia terrae]|uniref:Uncharacterized protein n=1 Tax=Paraburkholderia terrae TaxID=311230 RepID=A0ABM7TYH7_9BURK|nr:hypothetical protein PTKU64_75930 [Paraburkholderia terrae]
MAILMSQTCGQFLSVVTAAIRDDDPRTFTRKQFGRRPANAGSATCNQCHLVGKAQWTARVRYGKRVS